MPDIFRTTSEDCVAQMIMRADKARHYDLIAPVNNVIDVGIVAAQRL